MLYLLFELLRPWWDTLRLFRYVTVRTAMAIVTAMVISFLLGPPLIRRLRQWQWGQYIREEGPKHHQQKAGTPTMGGLLVILAVSVAVLLWADLAEPYPWVALGTLWSFGALGFWDDWAKLRRRQNLGLTGRGKLLAQTAIILVIGLALMYLRHRGMFSTEVWFPFLKWLHPDLGWWYLAFLWLVLAGASNAVNLTDGLDGLAIGSVLFASAALTGFAYVAGHRVFAGYLNILHVPQAAEVVIFGGALMGASIGFLWFNAHPAEVFMGDVGALSLGASLGILSVLIKQELVLVMVGGLFVLEALSVILQVASFRLRGRRIFRMAPLHHHFELLGWPESKVVVRFWILAFLFALLSLTTLKLR